MVKKTLFPIFLFFLVLDCSQINKNRTNKDVEMNGNLGHLEKVENEDEFGYVEQFFRRKDDYAREGSYEKYSPEGALVEKATYINDTINGTRIIFSEKGDTQIVETYKMGVFNGPFIAYHEKGGKELIGHYENDVMVGVWEKYYPGGALFEKVNFKNNQENGPFVEYYENGNLKAEGEYLDGDNEHGLLRLYNDKGELIKKMECDKGICKTIWKASEN